jgi:hypothetical protein
MPAGYLFAVALYSWGVVCALTRWRRLGSLSAIPALLVSELPFILGYLLIASTVLALADGDLGSPGGAAGAAVALLALAGLVVIVRRAMRAHAALRSPPQSQHGRGAASCAPPASRAGPAWSGCAALPTATGRAARWRCTTAATSQPARRSCCISMAAASPPATRPAKRGR